MLLLGVTVSALTTFTVAAILVYLGSELAPPNFKVLVHLNHEI